ncbi:hypothetical protein Emag_003354 [Eimeria magna]
MSQFRDTFTKDEQRENLLDYDDNAFMFFLCSVTVCILIPWSFFFLWKCLAVTKAYQRRYPKKSPAGSTFRYCQCSACIAQRAKLHEELSLFRTRFLTKGRLIEFGALVVCWLGFILICRNLQDVQSIKTFDPFEILDVSPSATQREIKKAYRLMSLKYHPDKNVNDPTQGAKFIMIAKAYQALTDEFLTHVMTEGTRFKSLPELLAASGESRAMKIERTDDKDMEELRSQIGPLRKQVFNLPIIARNCYLIYGHMQRLHSYMNPRLLEKLHQLLKDSLPITQCMMEVSVLSDWFLTAQSVLEFRRSLIQAIEGRSQSLLQIPHYDESFTRRIHRDKHAIRDLGTFLSQGREVDWLSEKENADIKAFCDHVSRMELKAEVIVDDEDEIVVGDIATCRITLTRKNLKEGEAAGAVHAPYFHEPKYEEWWLFLQEKSDSPSGGRLINFVKCRNLERVVKESLQFRVGRPGKNTLTLVAMCDSYDGLDTSIDVDYHVYTPEQKPREVFVHPEDVKLDEEPTLFQQMLGRCSQLADHIFARRSLMSFVEAIVKRCGLLNSGDMCVNSSDEEEEFDMDDVPKQVRKKPALNADGAATSKLPESQKNGEPGTQKTPADEAKQNDDAAPKAQG